MSAELVVDKRWSDIDQLIFRTEKVREGQQKVRLLRPPGCRLQIGIPAGVMDAELEGEVVEVIEVMLVEKLLPPKCLPLLLLDLVHGPADHLQDGLQWIF